MNKSTLYVITPIAIFENTYKPHYFEIKKKKNAAQKADPIEKWWFSRVLVLPPAPL